MEGCRLLLMMQGPPVLACHAGALGGAASAGRDGWDVLGEGASGDVALLDTGRYVAMAKELAEPAAKAEFGDLVTLRSVSMKRMGGWS